MKKGFTITEMLATVIILCIIAMIAFPPILKIVKGTEKEMDEKTNELVITAASQYVTIHNNDYPKSINSVYYITIEDLVKEQLLSNNLIENSNLELNSCVKLIVNNDYKYEYNVEIICSK